MNTPTSFSSKIPTFGEVPGAPKKRKIERTSTWFDFDNETHVSRMNRVLFNDPTGPGSYTRRTAIVNLVLDTCEIVSSNDVKNILDQVELICLKAKLNHDSSKIEILEKNYNENA